ncbi:hypothetical protein AM501_31130 [Aneurinibacillus migulanus]|uniref:helix-turn-helix transcriptional regulator n=1 Tax=Aneurinibacillus migulanus TaxID=47500 RepID=UPI0005BB5829|nr:helix-turn-helix transcriptional regulator [Aneurinibacillus migulanus]KIV56342.1 hypothetical protein TS64_09875 [Aneurinibacillus migulanus]KPD04547.1 hypothetical protein AM501_31130 [Aneurinibacillus migulanus]
MRLYRPLQPPKLQHEVLDSNYRYREYFPSKGLESYVACYWTIDFHAMDTNKLNRIIPDGCVDIIFDLRSPSYSKVAFVAGLMTKFEIINLSQNHFLFGIRFFSETVHYFLRNPVSSFIGNRVFLEDIWGNEAIFMVEEIIAATEISEIIEKVELKLIKCLLLNEVNADGLLQKSMQYIYDHQGIISVGSLAEKLSYSERNIRRTFQKELGVSPKELISIIRFQNLLQELNNSFPSRFTDITVKYGYYDQSHLIKNFKCFYGMLPTQIFKTKPIR